MWGEGGKGEGEREREGGEIVKYTNVTFETDESVLFIEVSSIQR